MFKFIKKWFLKRYYISCLREVKYRIIKGNHGDESLKLVDRFYNYKLYLISKKT